MPSQAVDLVERKKTHRSIWLGLSGNKNLWDRGARRSTRASLKAEIVDQMMILREEDVILWEREEKHISKAWLVGAEGRMLIGLIRASLKAND